MRTDEAAQRIVFDNICMKNETVSHIYCDNV